VEFSDVLPWIVFAAWVLPALLRRFSRREGDPPPAPPAEPAAPPQAWFSERVERVSRALNDASDACDPRMAGLLAPELQSMTDVLGSLRQDLAEGTPAPDLLQQLGGLEAGCRQVTAVGEQRRVTSLRALHETGDRLSEGLFLPVRQEAAQRGLGLEIRPPLVVVGAPSRTQLAGTVMLPPAVRDRPWEWSILAESLGRSVADASIEEAFGALRLDVGDEPLGADSPALARVLFGAWLYVVITDASALLLLGPAYLRALAARLRGRGGARGATRVQLGPEGLDPEPPPHARIHLAAEWLTLMGEERASREVLEPWDAELGHPEALSLISSDGVVPLPFRPMLGHFHDILEDLDGLRLAALGRSRLGELPGLSGWDREARAARAVRDRLVGGKPAAASPRALLAATVEAALENPAAGSSISSALLASLRGGGIAAVARKQRAASPRKATRRKVGGGVRVAEALLIGELILDRPSRR
jgi:hypothetical protein